MLLVRRDALLVLDFGFDIPDGVTDLEGDGVAYQGLHKDLYRCVLVEEKEQDYVS